MSATLGSTPLVLGTATEKPGAVTRGEIQLVALPTGGYETVPVVIVSGAKPGPTFLITANIHGDEVVGTLVCHRFIESLKPAELSGRIVLVPSLNPSGMRALTRFSQLQPVDPNRKWPSGHPKAGAAWQDSGDWLNEFTAQEFDPGPQERGWQRLFDELCKAKPDFHIDLHSFTPLSIPFSFLDRVFHTGDVKAAEALAQKSQSMLEAAGFSIFTEASPKNLLRTDMYRTTSGLFLNKFRIPAATIELGMSSQASFENKEAGVQAMRNILHWAKMLPGSPAPLQNVTVVRPEKAHRVLQYPYAPYSGILEPLTRPGQAFRKSEVLGVFRTLAGERLGDLKADFDGYMIGWRKGVAHFEGAPVAWVAVEDRMPLIEKWE